jgi:arabinogalactan endo-1,4-beta-galactosidase
MKNRVRKNVALALALTVMVTSGCSGTKAGDAEENTQSEAQQEAAENEDTAETNALTGLVYELPAEAEEAGVYVEPIENLSVDFIRGVDISSVIAEENSGVVYYNEAGEEQDIFQTLAQNGVNYIRVRVWNDPYDEEGNGYGGGNNDAATAAEIGRRAAQYGMKLCVDFHYSDFWADPSKQQCPKAWEDMDIDEKSEALSEFTEKSLQTIIDAGAQVGIVQIGNEINNGLAGETDWTKRGQLLRSASAAVRQTAEENSLDIKIAVHFTDVSDQEGIMKNAQKLLDKEVDYDIFAVSYYPFWHGTTENLTETLKLVSQTYDKDVLVVENSYPYTTEDGDGFANSIDEDDLLPEYMATQQGQTNEIRDVCAAVAAVGDAGLGYFYWEPAWIPVGVYDEADAEADKVLADNTAKWEQFGSGWASSYAASYDPNDAGKYYGGSSWDNQALFSDDGYPLESLKVFKYLQCGTIVDQVVEQIPRVELTVNLNGELTMPETAEVLLNDRTSLSVPVIWNEEDLAQVDTAGAGEYEVTGTFDVAALSTDQAQWTAATLDFLESETVTADISVCRQNLIINSSFEDADTSMWKITAVGSDMTDFQDKEADAHSGTMALHFYSTDEISFTVEQTVTDLEPGTYEFGVYLQGGDAGDDPDMYIYADNGGEELTEKTTVTGWVNWQNPVITNITVGEDGTLTVGASISCKAKGWGTLDDFYLYRIE